jgi:glucose 1-dehydrogenase
LINAAGVPPREKRILDLTLDEWNATLRTNLTGPFLAATRFALALPLDQAGAIVNISSVHEEMPAARVAEYAAAKGGLRNLTRCLALELSDRNITVNAIAPGTILTQMNPDLLADPAALADHERTIPLGRAGTVDDVAGVAVFLAGPAARYMTGTTVTVDGGMLLNVDAGPVVR